ncbi:MAG: hypothetical protein M3457_22150, partial [Chloroflexota bacterium]|nr:hypothetical protein [Chloroflexota bacterium]
SLWASRVEAPARRRSAAALEGPAPLYLLVTAVAFWNAYLSLMMCFALWILWAYTGQAQPAGSD